MKIVVKNIQVKKLSGETRGEAERRVKAGLIYEARIINKLGDHPGVPYLYGFVANAHRFA